MNRIASLIDRMVADKRLVVRSPHDLSWGDRDYCEGLFCEIFRRVDTSIVRYRHLPEYVGIIDWMTSTEGRGLLLYGDCGRGKSIILTGVVPVLLAMKERMTVAIHADELSKPYDLALRTAGYDVHTTNLDYLTRTAYPIIDELGVAPLVFISTNLTREQLLRRYGERTFDRLTRLCRPVKFEGESLR